MCPGCRALLSPDEPSCPYCGWNVQVTEVRRHGGGVEKALRRVGGLVPALIGANVLLYLATLALEAALSGDSAIERRLHPWIETLNAFGANLPVRVREGDWWRILCPVFLHGGLLHLAVNMMSLQSIGGLVEEAYGGGKALALYLLSGVAGTAASVAWSLHSGERGDIPHIGASGAIMGAAGILIALALRWGGEGGKRIWMPLLKSVGLTMALGWFLNFDNAAHAGGLLFGFAAGWICTFGVRARGNPAAVRAWDFTAVVLVLLTVASFARAAFDVREALQKV